MLAINSRYIPNAAEMLQFETIGEDRFRASHNLDNMAGVTFGGQALGQSLAAATLTVDGWQCHSLSGVFMRGGIIDEPIDYVVARLSDSRNFATRRVTAEQRGRVIFELLCSFHKGEEGLCHQFADLGNPADPESLLSLDQFAKQNAHRLPEHIVAVLTKPYIIELRMLKPEHYFDSPDTAFRDYWIRLPSASVVSDERDHHSLLALLSDYWLPGTIAVPHGRDSGVSFLASLNHSMWIHAPVKVDQWLLYRTESHWAANGRGLATGKIFTQTGQLIATVTQEAVLR
ncbi:acyl-CoA thioesterase [Zhongshania sp. BJYM1]|uniref:acyl-CoA thioesterase n=1 Tax=Zhongshania aquatica TaxID=2965069 RepID=UPI0022B3DC89|nr:acyl-CoA thioesterase domain-containing protein [Marortus sp. BJYM1]